MTNIEARKKELIVQMKGTREKMGEYKADMMRLQLQGDIDGAFQKKKALDFAKDWFAKLETEYKRLRNKSNQE